MNKEEILEGIWIIVGLPFIIAGMLTGFCVKSFFVGWEFMEELFF